MSDEVKRDVMIRIDAPSVGPAPGSVTHVYSLEALIRAAYEWGHLDERAWCEGNQSLGFGQGWTLGGVDLDSIRRRVAEDFAESRKSLVQKYPPRDGVCDMGRIEDKFKDWLDGGKDSPENQAEQAKPEDAAKKPEDQK